MEFEPEECDYDIYGDTRNRKGKIEQGYNSHNRGYKELKRINYIKQKRMEQSQADKGMNVIPQNEEIIDNSKKRKLKYTANEEDKFYGNNYTPIENKIKKKKNSKKDKIRFQIIKLELFEQFYKQI